MSPARAIPSPFRRPMLLRILERDMCPRMIAGMPVKTEKQKNDKIPRTRLAVALPSVLASGPGCPYALAGYGAGAAEPAGAPADEGTCGALICFPHWEHTVDPSAILAPQFGQNIAGLAEC